MVFKLDLLGDHFVEKDEYADSDGPLKQDCSHRGFVEGIQPTSGIVGVAIPEPPAEHGQDLDREKKLDEKVESSPQLQFALRDGYDLLSEERWADLENEDNEKRTADHESQAPHPVLVVEETHKNG